MDDVAREISNRPKQPASLDDSIAPDTRLKVLRHVHEPAVAAGVPTVLFEDDQLLVVDKPAGLPTLAGAGPGLAGENNAMAVMNRVARVPLSSGGGGMGGGGGGGGGGDMNRVVRVPLSAGSNPERHGDQESHQDQESHEEQAAVFAVNRIDKPVSGRVWQIMPATSSNVF